MKIHLLLILGSDVDIAAKINRGVTSNSKSENLLDIAMVCKLSGDVHVSEICGKVCQKLTHFFFYRTTLKRGMIKDS